MDTESRETVIRILTRIKQVISTNRTWLDIFTREEQEKIKAFQEKLSFAVLQISDDLFAWEDYLLPENIASGVMHWRQNFPVLKTLNSARGKVIIDAGAYIGDSALAFSELEASAIYAFEPMPTDFALLKRTLELNNIANAIPENMALGAKSGTVTMHVKRGSSTYLDVKWIKSEGDVAVPVCALDDYVVEHPMQVGIIKTDVEGAEMDLLEGAKKTICEQRPILLISIYHTARDFFEIKPLIESWDLGYRFSIYHPAIASASNETLLIGEI